jgi:tetratricopeptide (TPR) repeat protein
MRWVIFFIILLTVSSSADQIDDLINDGHFHEAYDRLLSAYEKSPDKLEYLFLMGRSALSGESSAAFFKDYINKASNNSHLVNWARLYLGKYYLAQNLYVTARKHLEDIADDSPFGMEATYLAARCYMLATEYDRATKAFTGIIDRYENNDSDRNEDGQSNYYYWSVLNLADTKYALGDYEQAIGSYQQLLQPFLEKDIFALALLGLSETSKKLKRWDDANRY